MELTSPETYHLDLNEVYPRQALYGFALSPDGERFVLVSQADRQVAEVGEGAGRRLQTMLVADLCLLPSAGGYPQPLTATGDFPDPVAWSPDGRWLAFTQGEELHVMATDGGQRRWTRQGQLYRPPASQFPGIGAPGDACWGYPRWSPDGAFLLVALREGYRALLRLVAADGAAQRDLVAAEGYIIAWDWSPDGRRIAFVTRNEDGWTGEIRVLDVASGESRVVSAEGDYAYQMPVVAWASDAALVFRSNRTGWSKLWTADVASGEIRPLTTGDWDDTAFRLSPDGRHIVYASRAEQPGSGDDLWRRPLAGGEALRLTRDGGVHAPLAWSRGGEIFYWRAGPTERGDLWAVPAIGSEPRRLTRSMPLATARKLRAPEEVTIPNPDGGPIPALVYRPAYQRDGERYPTIVWIHGGPTMVARADYAPYFNWLANLGYIVIVPNYRGSVGYGVAHMNAVAGDGLGRADLSDVLAAGQYARALPDVDLRRGVGVGGRSWGGYLGLMAVTHAPDAFSCAVAGAAISDWFIQQAGTEVRYYDHWLVGGWVYEQAALARERSPIHGVEQIKVPLFVFHGEADASVPFAQIEAFVARARQAGIPVEFASYPLEGHSNRKPENQADVLARTKAFFARHLQPWNLRDNPCAGQIQ